MEKHEKPARCRERSPDSPHLERSLRSQKHISQEEKQERALPPFPSFLLRTPVSGLGGHTRFTALQLRTPGSRENDTSSSTEAGGWRGPAHGFHTSRCMALAVQGPGPGPLPANADTAHILRFQSPPSGRLHLTSQRRRQGRRKLADTHPPADHYREPGGQAQGKVLGEHKMQYLTSQN